MKKRILISVIAVTLLIIFVYGAGIAASQPAPPHQGKWWNNPEVAKQLNLTESQLKTIDSLFNEKKEVFKNLIQETRKIDTELKALMGKNFDQSRALSLVDKLAENRSKMMKERLSMNIKILGVLSPEQREILAQKRHEMTEKRKSMMKNKGMMKDKGFEEGKGF